MADHRPTPAEGEDVDFDLHGLVGVRLVDAAPSDVAAVRRQLGPVQRPLLREPDVVIRFVDRLTTSSTLRYLGPDEAGFTDDAFLVLRSKHKAKSRVQVPMAQVGGRCELVCERGLPAVPLLIPILNLTVLANGGLALHAAAFEYGGSGAVVTGWSKGGKTESLLAFAAGHGGRYVADEWAYLDGDGETVAGVPEPVRVWDWHLSELLDHGDHGGLSAGTRARLGMLRLATSAHARVPEPARRYRPVRAGDRVAHALQRQRHVDLPPEQLFDTGLGSLPARFDVLFYVESTDRSGTTVEPVDPAEVAARMVASLQYERLPFRGYYEMFRCAFPDASNPFVEGAEQRERERLAHVFGGKVAYRVEHPYPVTLAALRAAMSPVMERGR